MLAFTLAVSILTGLIAGLAPALQASKPDLKDLLKEGAKGSQGGARRQLRKVLVVAEIALAFVLLVGAGMMVKSFLRLQQTELGDVKHEEIVGEGGLDLYVSYQQVGDSNMYLLLRTKVAPIALAEAATRAVWAGDPEQSTFNIVTMDERIANTIWQRRLSGALFIVFAALALVLASVGIYGVMSYVVSQRTREIGIRMAMGARPRDVLKLVIGQGAKLIAVGLGAGLIVAFIASRIINSLLYRVSASDPLTYLVVPLLLAAVALLACYIPARRAMKVDPMTALRVE